MYIFVLIIHIIASFVLIGVILLQAGKGGGLAGTFGGGGSQTTIFGQKSSDFLTKATTTSAVLFLCTSLTLALLSSKRQRSIMEGANILPTAASTMPTGTESAQSSGQDGIPVQEIEIIPEDTQEVISEVQQVMPDIEETVLPTEPPPFRGPGTDLE
ncbi:preprotein translocase subunit SecG [Candidatus Omnitrophota bacterium]